MKTDIISIMENEKALGKFYPKRGGNDSWFFWKCFHAASQGSEPSWDDITKNLDARDIFESCTKRSEWPKNPAKYIFCNVGRRGGKSEAAVVQAIYHSVFKDYSDVLKGGENYE